MFTVEVQMINCAKILIHTCGMALWHDIRHKWIRTQKVVHFDTCTIIEMDVNGHNGKNSLFFWKRGGLV